MKEIKIKLGEAVYTVELSKIRGQYAYALYRNKKGISSTVTPSNTRDEIKMRISEAIMQNAFYEVNHEIEKLEL